jgi:hypothetical protein
MDSDTAKKLLRSSSLSVFIEEEEKRCWSKKVAVQDGRPSPVFTRFNPGSIFERLWDKPILRIYDYMSGSRPEEDRRMLARASRMNLSTQHARRTTLKIHADHKKWEPTPYISFTDSPVDIASFAQQRRADGKRGDQTLVVIDPRRRFELGLPIIRAEEEMRYYHVDDPYRRDYQYYENHYLCLWEVTPEEVVGTWDWNELSKDENWYEQSILSKLAARRRLEKQISSAEDLVASMNSLAMNSLLPQAKALPKVSNTRGCSNAGYMDSRPDIDSVEDSQHFEHVPSHRHERPEVEWSYELQGFYTEEEEYEQLGWNGNHERMIDGLWD